MDVSNNHTVIECGDWYAMHRCTVEAGHLAKHCCCCGTTWEVEP